MKKHLLAGLSSLLFPMSMYGLSSNTGNYQQRSYLRAAASSGNALRLPGRMPSFETPPMTTADISQPDIFAGSPARELVIIDAAVPDKHAFHAQIRPGFDVIELAADKDGLAQLQRVLSEYSNLQAVHIISHADAGVLRLGNSRISATNVYDNIDTFAAINGAIKPNGDILFYGCNLAAGADGAEFLDILAANTHADVAASDDTTGNGEQGGDWELEIHKGNIETQQPFSEVALRDFSSVLLDQTITMGGFATGFSEPKTATYGAYTARLSLDSGDPPPNEDSLYCYAYYGNSRCIVDYSGASTGDKKLYFDFTGGEQFNVTSFTLYSGYLQNFRISSDNGDTTDVELEPIDGITTVPLNWTGITRLTIEKVDGSDITYARIDDMVLTNISLAPDNDGNLIAAAGVTEPVGLGTTIDTVGEAVDVFDFTISDGGTADALATTVSQIVVNVSGTSTDAERSQITWRLDGPDVSNVTGTYNAGADIITFSGLSISIANGGNETYTVNAYYNDNLFLTEDHTFILSVDGDTDLTVGASGTQMGATSAVTNGTGSTIDVVATQLAFTTEPAGSVSGAALTTQPVVTAQDAFFNTDVDFTETITLTEASAGTLTNSTQAATAGVATFTNLTYTATADQQSFTLTANDQDGVGSNLSTVDSDPVTSDVVATKLLFSTQPSPTTVNSGISASFTTVPVVSATDANDTVDTGYATDITLAEVNGAGSATMSATGDTDGNGSTVSITPSSGVATFTGMEITYTASGGSDETFNLQASSGGLTTADSSQLTGVVNAPPAIGNLDGDSVAWAGIGSTVTLDSGGSATASDAELDALNGANGDYSGGSLMIQRNGGAVTSDILGFDTGGALFTVSGSNLQAGGQTFATFTNTNGVLTISFTSSDTTATTALVSDVLRRVTYRNDTPAGDATVRFTLSDGTASTTADVTVTTDNIYITNTSDTATIDPTDGTSFSEAIAIAAADGTGTQTLIFDSSLAGQTVSATSATSLSESLTLDMDSASGATLSGGTLTLGGGVTLTLNNGTSDTVSIGTVFAGTGALAKTGDGMVTLTGTQTYSGTTTITGGTVSVASDSNLGSGQLVLNGGTLSTTSNTTIDNAINIAADSTFNHSTDASLSGLFTGSGNLSLSGSGELQISNTGNEASSSATLTLVSGSVWLNNDDVLPSGAITLNGGTLSTNGLSGTSITIDNNFVLGASGGTLDIFGGGGNFTLELSGVISGTGNLLKTSAARVSLTGTNTYTGTTTIQTGQIIVAGDSNLGSGSVVFNGGTLTVTGSGITIDNAVTMTGNGTLGNANAITLSGVISGTGTLTKSDAGTLTLSGTQTQTGGLTVTGGAVSIAGDSNLGSGTVTLHGGGLTVTGSGTIDNAFNMGSNNGTLTNANAVTLSGIISNSGDLTKTGAGTLTLFATNTFTGTTTVSAGTLIISGSMAGAVTVENGALLQVDNSIGGLVTVNSGGWMGTNSSPVAVTLGNGLTVNAGGTINARIDGNTAGTGYDQYNVTGAVSLGGTLSLTGTYTPVSGDTFVIIDNDAADAVTGTFNGLAEGGTVSFSGEPLTASYSGGSGNDVTLGVVPPDITDGNISISGSTGTGGAYKIGDTVTATWDDTAATGDNNGDIASVTVDFSAFGGGAAVSATNSSDTWTATYTIVAGAIDGTNLNVSVTATDNDGIEGTAADTTNATVDNEAPEVTDGNISISGSSGTGGAYIIDDTVTVTWTDTGGDSNSDTISGVTVDFSAFGGGAAVAATNSSGVWTATYSITAGAVDGTNLNVSVTATDNAGNTTTTADTTSATVDNEAPTVTDGNISLSGASGTGGAFINGDTVTATWTDTGGDSNGDTISGVTVDFSAFGGGAAVAATNSGGVWTATYNITGASTSGSNLNVAVTATDNAGNSTTTADTSNATVDSQVPALNSSTPADDATGVAFDADLVLTFSEDVIPRAGADAAIELYDSGDNLVTTAIVTSSDVSVSGNVVTVDFFPDLWPTMSYYVHISGTAFEDAAGNLYAGFANETTLNFTIGNDAPVANDDSDTTDEDTAVQVDVLANDTDSDSSLNAASTIVVTAPANGSTSVNTATGVITYTPDDDFNGSDSFTYTVEDVQGGLSNTATVSVTVTAINDAPVAVNDLESTPEDTNASFDVAANDTDVDAGDSVDTATITIVTPPANGSATVNAGLVDYDPDADFNGTDTFTYTIEDQNGALSNEATVTINVTGVNDLPTAGDDSASVDEDDFVDIDVLTNDSDLDGTLDSTTVTVMANPANGSTSVDALTGVITYTPSADYNGNDSFTYVVQDDAGGTSNAATVTLTVNSVNDAPVAANDTAVMLEDTAHEVNVLGNDSDVDGTLVPASVEVVTAPADGSTSINATTGAITYTPDEDFSGSDAFTYRVQDNDGVWSSAATVTMTVDNVNDPPVANDDSATLDEDASVDINILANDIDIDDTVDATSVVVTSAPTNGSADVNPDGSVTYTPAANFSGIDSFIYEVDDAVGDTSNTATVSITIDPVNDAPVISGTPATTVAQDSAYIFTPSSSDVENDTLTFSVTNLPGWASFDTASGVISGTPGNGDVGTSGSIVISASDGIDSTDLTAFTITVTNLNDAPTISGTPATSVLQDMPYSFTPTVDDVDTGDTLTFSIANQPAWASFDTATGALTGVPGNSNVGMTSGIVISVSDGTVTTALPAFNITVGNVNDAPLTGEDSYNLSEGDLLQVDAIEGVLANDVDIDGDTLTTTVVDAPASASAFTLNTDGSFSYQHDGTESRSDSFSYEVSDGTVTTEPVMVNLTIAAVNDAPEFVTTPGTTSVVRGTDFFYEVGINDPDSVVQLTLLAAPEWLTLNNSTLSGTAPADAASPASIQLRASDGEFTVDQSFDLTLVDPEDSVVTLATDWYKLPARVGEPLRLDITLTQTNGPALSDATLRVRLRGESSGATMEGCTVTAADLFECPTSLTAESADEFRLRLTPDEEGNLAVELRLLDSDGNTIVEGITDVTVSEKPVSQGNLIHVLAHATALASIELVDDDNRELVVGTSLGDTVKLVDYDLATLSAEEIGEIDNDGETESVRVADVNLDNLPDILVVNSEGDATQLYYNMGGLVFEEDLADSELPYAGEAVFIDLNDDDYPELVLGANGFNIYVYENNNGYFDEEPYVMHLPIAVRHFAVFNRPVGADPYTGKLAVSGSHSVRLFNFDLLDTSVGNNKPSLQSAAPETMLRKTTQLSQLDIPDVTSIQLADLDGDNSEEILLSSDHSDNSADDSGMKIVSVSSTDVMTQVAAFGNAGARKVSLADFNGDGAHDLLVANNNFTYQFYLGAGSLTGWTLKDTVIYQESSLVLVEDVNNDELSDVLVYNDGEDEMEFYTSAANGEIGVATDLQLTSSAAALGENDYRFNYVLTVGNQGSNEAQAVETTVTLPDSISVSSLPDNCSQDENEITCALQTVNAGGTASVTLVLVGDTSINSQSLTAQVTSDALEQQSSDNSHTQSLSGMFEGTKIRVSGGSGSFGPAGLLLLGLLALMRSRRLRRSLLPVFVCFLFIPSGQTQTFAEDPFQNSYLELDFGKVSGDWDRNDFDSHLNDATPDGEISSVDDERNGWQLLYGYRVNEIFAIEGGYLDWGDTDLQLEAFTYDLNGIRQLLRDHYPASGEGPYLGSRVSYHNARDMEFYLKGGIWIWQSEYTIRIGDYQERIENDDTDLLLGAGFAIPVYQDLSLGGQVQRVSLGGENQTWLGLSIQFDFK